MPTSVLAHRKALSVVAVVVATSVVGVGSSEADPAPGAKVTVNVTTPDGVPALVHLDGATASHYASKTHAGTSTSTTIDATDDTYSVVAEPVMVGDVRYVGTVSQDTVTPTDRATVDVTYTKAASLGTVRPTMIGERSVALSWNGDSATVRRAVENQPPSAFGATSGGRVDGGQLTDTDLEPGTQYTYSIATDDGDAASVTVATTSGASGDPSFVTRPGTVLLAAEQVSAATPQAGGVALTLAAGVDTPAPGTTVSVPSVGALTDGYLGNVVDVSSDGRTITLTAAGIGDGFSYYHVDVPDLATLQGTQAPGARAVNPCKTNDDLTVDFDPSLDLVGHANVTYDYFDLEKKFPKGVNFDVESALVAKAKLGVKASGEASCEFKLPQTTWTFPAGPVPLAITADPRAKFTADGSVAVSNVGAELKTGFGLTGSLSLDAAPELKGRTIREFTMYEPEFAPARASVGAVFSARVEFGVGVGTPNAGAMVGIGASVTPLDAKLGLTVTDAKNPCLTATYGGSAEAYVMAKAWLGELEAGTSFRIPGAYGTWQYPGSPFAWPAGCAGPVHEPSIIGDGVTVESSSFTGDVAQWGSVGNLVPETTSWALSTGEAKAAKGHPWGLASGRFGGRGDERLTAEVGEPTFDAASHRMRVTPAGKTLRIDYLFGSEEYLRLPSLRRPDAARIYVDGVNCAMVPGTDVPVGLDSINDRTNAEFYLLNHGFGSLHNTTLTGTTKPLACEVPVTPGQPVDVEFVVADGRDDHYDTAIILSENAITSR